MELRARDEQIRVNLKKVLETAIIPQPPREPEPPRPPNEKRDRRRRDEIPRGPRKRPEFQEFEHPDDIEIEDEEERARKAQERRKTVYEEREKRWVQREQQRVQMNARDEQVEIERQERREMARIEMDKKLSEWDDTREEQLAQTEYYQDRRAWRSKRQEIRRLESEQDERDRRREELARERQELLLKEQQQREALSKSTEEPVQKKPRTGRTDWSEFAGEEEEYGRKKRVLVPLVYKEEKMDVKAAIQALVDEIPITPKEAFRWPIKWKEIDDALWVKMKTFTGKKVLEIIKVPEPEIVNVVMSHLRQQRPATELVKELEMALDVAASDLVLKIWRLLIFETESRFRKITT